MLARGPDRLGKSDTQGEERVTKRASSRLFAFSIAAVTLASLGSGLLATDGFAQSTRAASSTSYDPTIRALQYYGYKRVAQSGPERGRELYYFKCWQCHNEFQTTAPQLKGLYERGTLVTTGEPVN